MAETVAAPPRAKPRWLFPVGITAIAVIVYIFVLAVVMSTNREEEPFPLAAASTTTIDVPQTATTFAEPAPVTTSPAPAATTIAPPSTTTTQPPPPIPASGEPIPLEDLSLGASALGPLDFGATNTNPLGRLVATFGQPDEIFPISEADGLCALEQGSAARFGWLTVLLRDEAGTDVLVGYRLEEPASGSIGHPTSELRTISGAAIGDSIGDWEATYRTSVVTTTEIDGQSFLMLLHSRNGTTLLWGPLSGDDPPEMLGIYSPRPCDGGPFSQGGGA